MWDVKILQDQHTELHLINETASTLQLVRGSNVLTGHEVPHLHRSLGVVQQKLPSPSHASRGLSLVTQAGHCSWTWFVDS